jgi:4-pyridoxolactonase
MVVKKVKTLIDGYYSIDMGMLIWLKPSYYGKKIMASLKSLYIETDNNRILVDTGIGELPPQYKKYYEIDRSTSLEKELKNMSLSVDDISIVINTHLHFDHTGNNALFKKAIHITQKDELDYALNPKQRFMRGGYIKESLEGYSFKTIQGKYELEEGITMIPTPGHTVGHQSVVVNYQSENIIFCGDVAPLKENLSKGLVIGISYDPVKAEKALDELIAMKGTKITSHDNDFYPIEEEYA